MPLLQANADMAAELGFPAAAAVTCVKPSGTVSQLCDSASGIHPRHSEYYIRRVRCNKDDPLTNFMIQVGHTAGCILCPFVFLCPCDSSEVRTNSTIRG